MKKYLVLFTGVFMFSACCAAPVRQVDVYGENPTYFVSIKSYPRHHHPVVLRPAHPKHIVHTPPPPKQFKPSKPNPSPHHHHGGKR